jgi:hypothetical protein
MTDLTAQPTALQNAPCSAMISSFFRRHRNFGAYLGNPDRGRDGGTLSTKALLVAVPDLTPLQRRAP